jgi:hypothetical protein
MALPFPVSGGDMYFQQNPDVIVQLVSSDGGDCFETTLSSPAKKNEPDQFKDKL